MLQREHDLRETRRARGGFEVADVGLHRAQQRGPLGLAALADDAAQCLRLDRVTEDRARAVRLDVVDCAWVDTRVLVRAAQHLGLGVGVRCQQAVGAAIVVGRAARDHGEDLVAVAAGVIDPLEHQHPAAFGAGVAVGIGAEGLDPAVAGQHAADLVEGHRDHRCDERVHSSGEHHVGLAAAQRLHALVHCHQRARACGVDGDRRAAEVVEI